MRAGRVESSIESTASLPLFAFVTAPRVYQTPLAHTTLNSGINMTISCPLNMLTKVGIPVQIKLHVYYRRCTIGVQCLRCLTCITSLRGPLEALLCSGPVMCTIIMC